MGKTENGLKINPMVHEKARLVILTALASADGGELTFTELKDAGGFSSGNLSVQMNNLEKAGYIDIKKSFISRKPRTTVVLSGRGLKALESYLAQMENLFKKLKTEKPE